MTVIYNMSIDRADKPWIGDRRLTEIRHQPAACERASRASDADARSLAQRSFCYGTHARSHARWGVAYIPPTRPTLLDRVFKVRKYSQPG